MLTHPSLGEMGALAVGTPCNPEMPTLVRNLPESLRGLSLGHLHPAPAMRMLHQPMTKSTVLVWQLLALSDLV